MYRDEIQLLGGERMNSTPRLRFILYNSAIFFRPILLTGAYSLLPIPGLSMAGVLLYANLMNGTKQ